jgi:NADH dehydrogenase
LSTPHLTASRRRVVIVGAGFGGLTAAKALASAPVEITLIDRRNYHLFQPLLYQVATAGLSPADIAHPIRGIVGRQPNTSVLLGRVEGIDTEAHAVVLADRRVPYDELILATGARHAYFGHDEWERYAHGLKKIDDATEIRRRILLAFERAEAEEDADEQRRSLTFVIVGGGPTGVEMAGALVELARKALARDFRRIDPGQARVVLVEAGPRLLSAFSERSSRIATRALQRLGVTVLLGKPVSGCDDGGVTVGGERIESRTVIWAAGVAASSAGKWVGAERDGAGRIKVGADLTVPGHPEIFAIGDTAYALDRKGRPLPGVATTAKQQGRYVAKVIAARAAGRPAPGPFRYRNYGNLATIGRKAAVVEFGWLRFSGFPAWVLWSFAHIYFLIGFRNRLVVAMSWAWSYVTFQRGTRLITGISGARPDAAGDGDVTTNPSSGSDRSTGAKNVVRLTR